MGCGRGGETTQLLSLLITDRWIWQLDKAHTHTEASSPEFQGCSCKKESESISLIWIHCLLHANVECEGAFILFNHQMVLLMPDCCHPDIQGTTNKQWMGTLKQTYEGVQRKVQLIQIQIYGSFNGIRNSTILLKGVSFISCLCIDNI